MKEFEFPPKTKTVLLSKIFLITIINLKKKHVFLSFFITFSKIQSYIKKIINWVIKKIKYNFLMENRVIFLEDEKCQRNFFFPLYSFSFINKYSVFLFLSSENKTKNKFFFIFDSSLYFLIFFLSLSIFSIFSNKIPFLFLFLFLSLFFFLFLFLFTSFLSKILKLEDKKKTKENF